MRDLADKVRVAVVQATPVMFNKKQGVEKTVELIEKAAEKIPTLLFFRSFLFRDIRWECTLDFQ